jgi:hypothetical protein
MSEQNSRGRVALVLSVAALVTSLALSAGPALARAVVDADKVDGLSAVKSTTSTQQRSGKLVATDPKTGKLPNNILAKAPDAAHLSGLPASAYKGTYLPPTVATTNPYPASVTSEEGTYQTPRPGYLFAQASTSFTVTCPDNGVVAAWLDIDGTNVDSSRQLLLHPSADTVMNVTLSGITGASLESGDHVVSVHFGCTGGQYGTYLALGGPGYAVLLPSSYQP